MSTTYEDLQKALAIGLGANDQLAIQRLRKRRDEQEEIAGAALREARRLDMEIVLLQRKQRNNWWEA
jgi:hypothetical protein